MVLFRSSGFRAARSRSLGLALCVVACGGKTGSKSRADPSSTSGTSNVDAGGTSSVDAGGTSNVDAGGTSSVDAGGTSSVDAGGTGGTGGTGADSGTGGRADTRGSDASGGSGGCEGGHWKLCNGDCVEIAYDPLNCGDCGVVCPEEVCPPCLDTCIPVDNGCTVGSCNQYCDEGLIDCGPTCVDVCNDANHCGACGNACPAGRQCIDGLCTCQAGLTLCGIVCTSLAEDQENCGACGNLCPQSATCLAGECVFI